MRLEGWIGLQVQNDKTLGKGGKSQNDGSSLYPKSHRVKREGHPVLFKMWAEILRLDLGRVRAHGSDQVLPLIGKTGKGTRLFCMDRCPSGAQGRSH